MATGDVLGLFISLLSGDYGHGMHCALCEEGEGVGLSLTKIEQGTNDAYLGRGSGCGGMVFEFGVGHPTQPNARVGWEGGGGSGIGIAIWFFGLQFGED